MSDTPPTTPRAQARLRARPPTSEMEVDLACSDARRHGWVQLPAGTQPGWRVTLVGDDRWWTVVQVHARRPEQRVDGVALYLPVTGVERR